MNTRVVKSINKLKGDNIHGAGWLSRQAISILNLAVDRSEAKTVADFVDEIQQVATALIQARPNMVSIVNYVNQFLHQVILRSRDEADVDNLKRFARSRGNELLRSSARAVSKAIEYGCGIISDLDVVITCSYSSTVCKVFELAKQKETRFSVIAAMSKFGETAFGEITGEQLKRCQIPVEIVPDENIHLCISKANKALVGADSISADGYLVNGTPTLLLAEAAKKKKVPFYVVCETAKFDIRNRAIETTNSQPGFDKAPLDLITGIITEKGTIQPNLVVSYIEKIREEMEQPPRWKEKDYLK